MIRMSLGRVKSKLSHGLDSKSHVYHGEAINIRVGFVEVLIHSLFFSIGKLNSFAISSDTICMHLCLEILELLQVQNTILISVGSTEGSHEFSLSLLMLLRSLILPGLDLLSSKDSIHLCFHQLSSRFDCLELFVSD